MTARSPVSIADLPAFPGWEETRQERTERYEDIARAVLEVSFDPEERPLFTGPRGRAHTALMLVAVAHHESGFARDVDVGPCYRGGNLRARCDGGNSACMVQIRIGSGTTREGWTQADLFADRSKCFRAGLHMLRRAHCSQNPQASQWVAYASGSCSNVTRAGLELEVFRRGFVTAAGKVPDDAGFLVVATPGS